jgi:pimeloyl-ACP methyl ester carboxylesterase
MTSTPAPTMSSTSSLMTVGAGTAAGVLISKALAEWRIGKEAEQRSPPRGHFVSVNGVGLHYLDAGDGGTPVLLLHGNGTMAEDFRASGVFQELARTNCVIAIDRPGFGYSDRPRNRLWSPSAQAELMIAALDALRVWRCIVVGHSWATLVALALASEHRDRVAGLVLVSGYYFPSFRWDAVASVGGALPIIGDAIHYTVSPIIGRRLLGRALQKQFAPRPIASTFLRRFPVGLMLRPWQMRASAKESAMMVAAAARLEATYERLELPVAIIAGDGDQIVDSRKQSQRLGQYLSNSTTYILTGCGHMLHYTVSGRNEITTAVRRLTALKEGLGSYEAEVLTGNNAAGNAVSASSDL